MAGIIEGNKMNAKAYKLEILIVDLEGLGKQGVIEAINSAHYSNDCISPSIKKIIERDIGEWSDDHPLNKFDTCQAEYQRLFEEI